MPNWMTELEKLVKGMGKDRDEDEYEGDEDEGGEDEGDEEEETPAPKPRARKSAGAGVCDPKPNAETTDTDSEPAVHNPRSLDKRSGGGPAPVRKSIEDVVSEDAADAMEVSGVLSELAKGINSLAGANDARVARLEKKLAGLEQGLAVIGSAISKGLVLQNGLVKSLAQDVEEIGKQPAGRKSITKSVERKFAGNDSEAPALPGANEIMAKSMKGLKAGTISAQEASALETARQTGKWGEVSRIWDRIKD